MIAPTTSRVTTGSKATTAVTRVTGSRAATERTRATVNRLVTVKAKAMDSKVATAAATRATGSKVTRATVETRAMETSNLDMVATRVMDNNSLATASSSSLDTANSNPATARTPARNTTSKGLVTSSLSRIRRSRIPAETTLRMAAGKTAVREGLRHTVVAISHPSPSAKRGPGTPSTCRRTLTAMGTPTNTERASRHSTRRLNSAVVGCSL